MAFRLKSEYDGICEKLCKGIVLRNLHEGSVDVLFNNKEELKTLHTFQNFGSLLRDVYVVSCVLFDYIRLSKI